MRVIWLTLEADHELSSERSRHGIEIAAEAITVQIVLHVSGVELIEYVEYAKADFGFASAETRQADLFG